MGLKDVEIYIKKSGGNKNCYCFGAEDTIKEVKEEIIKRANYSAATMKAKHFVKAERCLCGDQTPVGAACTAHELRI